MKLENNEDIAKVLKISGDSISDWIDDYQFRNRTGTTKTPHKTLRSTKNLPDKERKEIIKFAEKEGKSGSFIEEDFIPIYKKSDEPTKKALRK